MTWTRRNFLKASAIGALASSLPLSAVRGRAKHVLSEGVFTELRRGVGTFTARGGTIGWLVNPDGCTVVDSQFPDTAAECLAGLRSRGGSTIDALINTHHHGDHTGGNAAFREATRKIVAHHESLQLHQRATTESPDAQAYADTTFQREWLLELGDETIRAKHYGPGHTGGDCTVSFDAANVIHMGDLVFNRAHPFIDRASGASISGWIETLETVAAEHSVDTLYIFGHGSSEAGVTGSRADLLVQRDYLSAVFEAGRQAVAAGLTREEAFALTAVPGFEDYASIAQWLTAGRSIVTAHDEITGFR